MKSVGLKLGRTARQFNPRIPHYSALVAGKSLPQIPPAWDWTEQANMPPDLGMMCNDTLGDSACAAIYHARQVWSANTGKMITEPDNAVKLLYHFACGWDPREPGEGPGGSEQTVLNYLLKIGAHIGDFGVRTERISAFIEVDPRIIEDVKRTIFSCGVAYIGFHVPSSLQPDIQPPKVWQVCQCDNRIIGGHAVVLVGYDAKYAKVISWGRYYKMSWQFFSTYVDEVYAIADSRWFTAIETTCRLGVSLPQLESLMHGL